MRIAIYVRVSTMTVGGKTWRGPERPTVGQKTGRS
jgi:hypothetical protein